MSEWRRMVEPGPDGKGLPGLVRAADAVLALAGIDAPDARQHAGALLVAGALIKLNRF